MLIRRACRDDAANACGVVRRSIIELCGSDHHDDPAMLNAWLGNKTTAIVAAWIADPGNTVLVAVEDETVLAVGAVNNDGEVTLNYVSPDARFRGVSRAMLAGLQGVAQDLGNKVCRLISTETAYRFYLSSGYESCGMPRGEFGTTSKYPMLKRLQTAARPHAGA